MARQLSLPALIAAVAAAGLGCVNLPQLPTSAIQAVRAASRPDAQATTSTRANPAPAAPAREAPPPRSAATCYAPEEAVADALSGPLDLVGVGAWPGVFRRLSCVYRNGRVFVVDERCGDPREPTGLLVHVLSPARGRATLFAEAGLPIGRARRPEYQSFVVGSASRREPPPSLDPAMDYEAVVSYETDAPASPRSNCTAGTQRPQGFCSKGSAISAPEYAARVEPFLREPPAGWYDLVRALVGLRVRAHAGIRPAALPLPRLVAWGASWARDQEITVDEVNLKRVGHPQGRSSSIALAADGGAWIAGTTAHAGATVPAVVRVDASGAKRFLKALPEKGMTTHEVAGVAAAPDGAVVLSPGYPDPGWKPTARVIRLDDKGNVRWQWLGRGKDRHKIPQIVTAQLTPQGTVLLRGYIQLVADGDVHLWTGELDGKGKAIREEVGEILPDHAASFD